jgi:hypothetical protein
VVSIAGTVLLLVEAYVVNFPGGQPQPFPVPAVYKHISALPPGAVLSLPDYARTANWFDEADYQYFSTAHWHPIVNGDSREWPPGFEDLAERMKKFPAPDAAATMRTIGVRYVVVHAARPEARGLAAPAQASADYRLLMRSHEDYLFEVTPGGGPAEDK